MAGAAALTIDVGNINAERRQLQNGADAAALSAALDCANGKCPDTTSTADMNKLSVLADANAADGATNVARVHGGAAVCGSPGSGLPACLDSSGNPVTLDSSLQECPSPKLPSSLDNFVRVYTQTLNASRTQTILPYTFGAMIAGAGSGANQQTCASVAYGPVGSFTADVPITLSLCMFDAMVSALGKNADGSPKLPASPDGTWPGYHGSNWPGSSALQIEYTTKYADTCPDSNGHVTNGSFGWLTNNGCQTAVTENKWVQGNPGNNMECPDMYKYWGKVISIPIFDCIKAQHDAPGVPPLATDPLCQIPPSGGGENTWYHIAGWASFYLSGYRFPGTAGASTTPDVSSATKLMLLSDLTPTSEPCSSPQSCLAGWLTHKALSEAPLGESESPPYGINGIQPVG
jgi:Flp pilus assembly protein TadG